MPHALPSSLFATTRRGWKYPDAPRNAILQILYVTRFLLGTPTLLRVNSDSPLVSEFPSPFRLPRPLRRTRSSARIYHGVDFPTHSQVRAPRLRAAGGTVRVADAPRLLWLRILTFSGERGHLVNSSSRAGRRVGRLPTTQRMISLGAGLILAHGVAGSLAL